MIRCPNCGNQIEEGSKTCIYCGSNPDVVIKRNERNRVLDDGKTKNKKRKNRILLIEVITILTIIVIYIQVFIPQIQSLVSTNKDIYKRKTCVEEYNGVWDSTNDICHTDYSDIEIK